ncbi:MAG: YecA family protein, partial [Blastocatellia bacterium]
QKHNTPIMKTGRNDLCHCGSGKKYKKCCLAKDEQAAREQAAPPTPPARPPDPIRDAWNARWEEFDAGDYETKLAIYEKTLDEPALMDKEMAMEMLGPLFDQTLERRDPDRFEALVEALRQRFPAIHEQREHSLLNDRIQHAIAAGRWEQAHALVRDFVKYIPEHFDTWGSIEDMLAWHGRLDLLVEVMRDAWPGVQNESDILPWAINSFRTRGVRYELMHYFSHATAPDADDPLLRERLLFYEPEIVDSRLHLWMGCLDGQFRRQWTMEDFLPHAKPGRKDEPEPHVEHLDTLCRQFTTWAHDQEQVPWTRAEMASDDLYRFIQRRLEGGIEYQESMLDAMRRSLGQLSTPLKKYPRPGHALCPDPDRLDHFLGGMLHFLAPRRHRVVNLYVQTPVWLRFLESQGLIDAALRRSAIENLRPVGANLRGAAGIFTSDPTLMAALVEEES